MLVQVFSKEHSYFGVRDPFPDIIGMESTALCQDVILINIFLKILFRRLQSPNPFPHPYCNILIHKCFTQKKEKLGSRNLSSFIICFSVPGTHMVCL